MTAGRGRLTQESGRPHNHVVVETGKVGPLRSLVAPRGTVAEAPAPCCRLLPPGSGVRRNLSSGLRDCSSPLFGLLEPITPRGVPCIGEKLEMRPTGRA
jgi:hypothetical protein